MMNFSQALDVLKAGDAVRLSNWQTSSTLRLQRPDEHSKMTEPYLYVEARFGRVPWVPSHLDLLSDNWQRASS